jgi:hypothetical protein
VSTGGDARTCTGRKNNMTINLYAGWTLFLAAILLLVSLGKLDLLLILLPLSLLLAFATGCSGHDKTRLTGPLKKG